LWNMPEQIKAYERGGCCQENMVWISRLFDMKDEAIKSFADLQTKFHCSQFSAACSTTTACKTEFNGNLACLPGGYRKHTESDFSGSSREAADAP
jgi:hypothetical protein